MPIRWLWELGLTQRSKQQFWSDCPEWFSLSLNAYLWNVFMRFVTFCTCLISSKPIISLTNLICRDNNLTTIVDTFRQGFLAESRNNHIVMLVGSTEKHIILYIFHISFNLCFPCTILHKLISSCVELDKITIHSRLFSISVLVTGCVLQFSVLILFSCRVCISLVVYCVSRLWFVCTTPHFPKLDKVILSE